MNLSDLMDTIKLQLTGDVLKFELNDETLEKIIQMSLQEMNRYYNATKLIELPAAKCINLKKHPEMGTIINVYRTDGVGMASDSARDPVAMSQLQMYNFGAAYYNPSWLNKIGAWNTAQQIRNTLSTDLVFKEDKSEGRLYINYSTGMPTKVTIEYVPKLKDVSEIVSEYWQDILLRLSLAHTKIAVGRVRTRFTQNDAIWQGDGEAILSEGNTELADLRERLRSSTDMFMFLD